MRRARLLQIGWERDLALDERGDPDAPTGDRVLVAVEACGVCHRDCIDRDGRFKFLRTPITPGHEAVGRVIAVGPHVRELRIGDRVATMHREHCGRCPSCQGGETGFCTAAVGVLGLLIDGGYATHLTVPETALYRTIDDLSASRAAVMHCTYGTAHRAIVRLGGLQPGKHVLITGANGGVGCAAIQIARALDAEVTAVIRKREHEGFVTEIGATHVIVDDGDRFHKMMSGRADVVLECVGQPTFHASTRAVRPGGRVVVIGNVNAERAQLNLGYLVLSGIQIKGSRGADHADMASLLALYERRPWSVPIDRELPLEYADRAQRLVKAGGLRGRVVLTM